MKILVCLKQVSAKESTLRLSEDSLHVRESDLSFEINEPDTFALEEALRLKEKLGGEVVVVSLGPARILASIREALAKGADRGIHIETEHSESVDRAWAAGRIAAAVREEKFDLVLTGLQSDDLGTGQTGVILAEILGLPHATIIMEIQIEECRIKAKRELENGWFEWVEMPLPALLTIQSGLNKPRYASLLGIKKARTKEIRRVTPAELGAEVSGTNTLRLRKIYVPIKSKNTEFLEGTPKEAAAKLVERIRREIASLQS
ncbi:MAG: electron transfer flavoprotein subunit beta/FixA family protein [Acidobacteria bacterium]|nr:electron transfer flavoprotein subunit beta/FixA family protein [Acidobacteriota bacterium]